MNRPVFLNIHVQGSECTTSLSGCEATDGIPGNKAFEMKPEQVLSRPNLTKPETSLVDDHGSVPVTLWNKQINTARDGQHYEIQNIRVLQYNGQKYLSSTTETKLVPSKHPLGQLQPQAIQLAKETLKRQLQEAEVLCDQVLTVEILKYFSCIT